MPSVIQIATDTLIFLQLLIGSNAAISDYMHGGAWQRQYDKAPSYLDTSYADMMEFLSEHNFEKYTAKHFLAELEDVCNCNSIPDLF